MTREVTLNGEKVRIERFTFAKAMRVITLLQLMQRAAPEISAEWAKFRLGYAKDYAQRIPRINALAQFGAALEHISEQEWERAGQEFTVPGSPSQAEVFFQMAPVFYDKVEAITLRLIGLLAMSNEDVERYLRSDDIWTRVDELVDKLVRTAPIDEVMELLLVSAEVIDGQVLAKAMGARERLGNTARLLGWSGSDSTGSTTSSESREQPSSPSSTPSPSDTDGDPTRSEHSTGETSTPSATSSLATA